MRSHPIVLLVRELTAAGPGRAAALLLLSVSSGAAFVAIVLVSGVLIDRVPAAIGRGPGSTEGRELFAAVGAISVLYLLQRTLEPVRQTIALGLGSRLSRRLHDHVLAASCGPHSIAHLEHPDTLDEFQRARDLEWSVAPMSRAVVGLSSAVTATVEGTAAAVILASWRWWAPCVLVAGWVATHVAMFRSNDPWGWDSDEVMPSRRRRGLYFDSGVMPSAAKELRLFGAGPWVTSRFAHWAAETVRAVASRRRGMRRQALISLALVAGAAVAVLGPLGAAAGGGEIGLGQVAVWTQAAIATMGLGYNDWDWWIWRGSMPLPRVLGLSRLTSDVGPAPSRRQTAGLPVRSIRFEGVRFAYPGGPTILDGLDLEIEAGRSLAIVGVNGAGKTTLVKLLCRLYDPLDGCITVDDIDLRHLEPASWRTRCAAVFQDFIRWPVSLRDNIALGHDMDAAGLQRALVRAGAAALAESAGLDAVLARGYDGGVEPSGGQWQRVALARAFAAVERGATVLVLDEPTANLDVRAEAELFDRFLDLTSGLTTILVSHRFSTVRRADQIAVIEHGRAVEVGSHEDLLVRDGVYASMFRLQAQAFRSDV